MKPKSSSVPAAQNQVVVDSYCYQCNTVTSMQLTIKDNQVIASTIVLKKKKTFNATKDGKPVYIDIEYTVPADQPQSHQGGEDGKGLIDQIIDCECLSGLKDCLNCANRLHDKHCQPSPAAEPSKDGNFFQCGCICHRSVEYTAGHTPCPIGCLGTFEKHCKAWDLFWEQHGPSSPPESGQTGETMEQRFSKIILEWIESQWKIEEQHQSGNPYTRLKFEYEAAKVEAKLKDFIKQELARQRSEIKQYIESHRLNGGGDDYDEVDGGQFLDFLAHLDQGDK